MSSWQDYQEFIAHHWSGMLGLSRLPPGETALDCFEVLVSIFTVILLLFFPWLTHSSILTWRIPWAEDPGWLLSTGSQRVGHTE